MSVDVADTSALVGGPIRRSGGKGRNAQYLLPHFARARVYAEACFGAGGMFFRIPPNTYEREAINDLDKSIVTFFRVLRDRTADLERVVAATPYARDEFILALEHSDDELEEARRVWIRSRQGFAGVAGSSGDWGRSNADKWNPDSAESKALLLRTYAGRLRRVSIDSVDASEFIDKWGTSETFAYVDPPYVDAGECYEHVIDHRRLAASCLAAVARGCRVAVSGYPSVLYDELFAGWRTIMRDVHSSTARESTGQRRTETLWMSYPPEDALGYAPPQRTLFDLGARTP